MAFLTLGSLTVLVQGDTMEEDEGDVIGEDVRAANGGLLSSVAGVKRRWTGTAGPLVEADYQTLRALHRTWVTASGDALNGVSVLVRVLAARSRYDRDGLGHRRTVFLTLDEV